MSAFLSPFSRFFALSLFFGLVTTSCSDSLTQDFGEVPALFVNGQTEWMDSIKLNYEPLFAFAFAIEDDDTWHQLRVNGITNGFIRYQGKIINDSEVGIGRSGKGVLEYEATEPGTTSFVVEVSDPNQQKGSAEVSLFIFENMPPVAMLQLAQTDEVAPHQVQIDATQSYDTDHRWNGVIEQWEFTIDDFYTTTLEQPTIEYIFPEAGEYTIHLRVKDNDGAWSERVTKTITVQ